MSIHPFVVEEISSISSTTINLILRNAKSGHPFSFRAGQYVALSFSRFDRPTPVRCFSIASSPVNSSRLEFGVKVSGSYTKALLDLEKGDPVYVSGPFGNFVIDENRDKQVVMLAGGIGITPFLSQIRFAAQTNQSTKITLVYSCQSQNDVPYVAELFRLMQRNPNLNVILAISRGAINKFPAEHVISGRITSELLANLSLTKDGQFDQNTYFICGPSGFMNGMAEILEKNGVGEDRIITEAFGQGSGKQGGTWGALPKQVYALSAIGVLLGSGIFMVSDILKALPAKQAAADAQNASVSVPNATSTSSQATSTLDPAATSIPVVTAPSTTSTKSTTATPTISAPTATYQAPVSRTS